MSVERRLAQSEAREKALIERLNQSRKALTYANHKLEEKGFDCGCDLSVGMPCDSHREVELARETILKNSSNVRRALDLEKWRTIEEYKRSIFEVLGKKITALTEYSPAQEEEDSDDTSPEANLFEALGPLLKELREDTIHDINDAIRELKNPFEDIE